MGLSNYLAYKLLLLLLLLSPAILVPLTGKTEGEPRTELDFEQENSSLESGEFSQDNLEAQDEEVLETLQMLDSFDPFTRVVHTELKKLNEVYAFMQELKNDSLEQEESSPESREGLLENWKARGKDGSEILQVLDSFDPFTRVVDTELKKLDEVYAFMQELKKDSLEQEDSSPETGGMIQEHVEAQDKDELEVPEILHSLDNSQRTLHGELKKLNEVYAFMQELKKQVLEQQRLEQERLEQVRLEKQRLSEMIRFPRAKLYTRTNFTGNYEEYDFKNASYQKGCHRLQRYSGQIKSIDTEGTCVRVFSNCICESWSQAFYPGMDGNSIDSKLGGVKCIGPCSSNELEGAEIRGSASQLTVSKPKKSVPGLIGDWWTISDFSEERSPPIHRYKLGFGNRLEGVTAFIHSEHLRSPTAAEKVRMSEQSYSNGRFQLDEDKEEVGFAIPLELGGPSNETYNVFPQDKAGAVNYRQAFVPVIKEYLLENSGSVLLAVRFFYDNSTALKPRGMWYRMHRIATDGVTYGYLFN